MNILNKLFILLFSFNLYASEVPSELQDFIPAGEFEGRLDGKDCHVEFKDRGWTFMVESYYKGEFRAQFRIDEAYPIDDFYSNNAGMNIVTKYNSPMGAQYDRKTEFFMQRDKNGKPAYIEVLEYSGSVWGWHSLENSLFCQL